MEREFPYQIVTFLNEEPTQSEPVYNGPHGWYPQVALKRRFKITNISEDQLFKTLQNFFSSYELPRIKTDTLTKPERMPVQVIHIANQDEIKTLHSDILHAFPGSIVSRYPEREGDNYYPHVTAEYGGAFVIPVKDHEHKTFPITNIWLLKDLTSDDSIAYTKIL